MCRHLDFITNISRFQVLKHIILDRFSVDKDTNDKIEQ